MALTSKICAIKSHQEMQCFIKLYFIFCEGDVNGVSHCHLQISVQPVTLGCFVW